MMLFSILLFTLIILTGSIVLIFIIGGGAFLMTFGDVIVFVCIIVWLLKQIAKKKK